MILKYLWRRKKPFKTLKNSTAYQVPEERVNGVNAGSLWIPIQAVKELLSDAQDFVSHQRFLAVLHFPAKLLNSRTEKSRLPVKKAEAADRNVVFTG